jgi:signal transduction histidine kinase
MMRDGDQSSWLYTACGLVRIARSELDAWTADPKRTVQTTSFDSSDGVILHSGLVSGFSPRVTRSVDGKLWFVTGSGVSVIDPRHLPFNKLAPPVHIEQITADRKTFEASSNLRLPPLVRDLEIDYTALSVVAPEKNRFRVKLEGRDPGWKDVGNERKAFYNDLPPRNYRFRVMASNNSGVWNEAGAAFDFSIAPAYYQTRWFQVSCAAAFLGLLWGLYRLRLQQIAQGFNARMEERVGERTRIARELHDTLLQSFQGLMLRLQVVEDLLPEGRAKEELEQSLERADQAIAEGREAVHDLRSSATTTNDLAQAVRALGNELSGEEGAAFRLLVEGPVRELHPIVRDEIYRIAREAIRNAFSHARAHQIEAEITYGERLLRVRIRDDGQGITPAIVEEGRPGHYGLPGMRERAGQIGAKLSIWSGVRSGTEIELSIAGSIAYGGSQGRSRLRLFRKAAG